MASVVYHFGSLFSAPSGVYLAHACNCKGSWRSGIASEFAWRFPLSYREYQDFCRAGAKPGDVLVCREENAQRVVCLFTSKGYAKTLDPREKILEATRVCLSKISDDRPLHMPRINSGLFDVPWPDSLALIEEAPFTKCNVWSLK